MAKPFLNSDVRLIRYDDERRVNEREPIAPI
jgi:hypothetical protein